ncbi:tRNA pseudouridine55 synthase [Arcanobacterium pluranimalium]|uniref:tRNA pseudouridine synthase B n=1 Tax=Arcanobacterium pluranimalium TaxID=108028 RepID=UPI00195B3DD7|nr:tRNA pseudouridine55 synthase [Arcanobacterium pluranimalium]
MPWGDLPQGISPAPDGIVLIDKDQNVTSHDVVGAMRRLAKTRKVGHAGTLDPMATGLLTIGIGKATRFLNYLSGCDKTYRTTICLGVSTSTEDAQGVPRTDRGPEFVQKFGKTIETLQTHTRMAGSDGCAGAVVESDEKNGVLDATVQVELDRARIALTGKIKQVPSAVSAIKINGKRAHELVRAGVDVEIPARDVTVYNFDFTSPLRLGKRLRVEGVEVQTLEIDAVVKCSAGTYIRALARDFGVQLGVDAHITMLRRTRVGDFEVSEANPVRQIAAGIDTGRNVPVIPLAQAAKNMPWIEITPQQRSALTYGQFIETPATEYPVALICGDELVAIGVKHGKKTRPAVVFAEQ